MVFIISIRSYQKFEHPLVAASSLWLVISFLCLINLFKIDYSDEVILILAVMLFSFFIGGVLYTLSLRTITIWESPYDNKSSSFRYTLFFTLATVSIIILISEEVPIILSLIQGASFLDIVIENEGVQTVETSGLMGLLHVLLVFPVVYLSSPVCSALIFSDFPHKKTAITLNVILVALTVIHHGGRLMLIMFCVSYLASYLIHKRKLVIEKRVKRSLLYLLIATFLLLIVISSSRGIEDVYKSFYAYFICDVVVLDGFLNTALSRLDTDFFLSLNGFFYPIAIFLKFFNIPYPTGYENAQLVRTALEENWYFIPAYDHSVNAFVPAGGYLYIDGGYLAEVVFLILVGFFCCKKYYAMESNLNIKTCSVYILLLLAILLSFMKLYSSSYQYVLAYLYMTFLFNTKTKNT